VLCLVLWTKLEAGLYLSCLPRLWRWPKGWQGVVPWVVLQLIAWLFDSLKQAGIVQAGKVSGGLWGHQKAQHPREAARRRGMQCRQAPNTTPLAGPIGSPLLRWLAARTALLARGGTCEWACMSVQCGHACRHACQVPCTSLKSMGCTWSYLAWGPVGSYSAAIDMILNSVFAVGARATLELAE
jgi:hypothetical protein